MPYAARVHRERPDSPNNARLADLRQPRGRSAALALAVGALALALAGCGSSGKPSASGGSASATTTSEATSEATTSAAATTSAIATTSPATVSPAEAAIPTPGCRHVPRPPSRAGEPASKPTETLSPSHRYTVRLQTNCGPIVIELAVQEAPETASSFAHLVQIGYYNDLTFHRIVPGFVIQGGDPNGNGTGGPSWQIVEPPPSNLRYVKGIVAMAKSPSAPSGASGSQFFIVVGSRVNLPPVYALVGHVISGMKAVEAIAAIPTEAPPEGGEASRPRVPVVIEKATLSSH